MGIFNNAVTGVILAGGSSRRMGQNKALMRLGTATIIEHVIRRMRAITADVLLITNPPPLYAHLGLPMQADIVPNMGTLGGIYTGLTYAANPSVLCVACDMPLLQPQLLSYLTSILGEYDAVVPYVEEKGASAPTFQTLSAVYSKRCLPVINQMLAEGELRVHALYDRIAVRRVEPQEWQPFDPQGLSFLNINTPADFEKAVQMIRWSEEIEK